MHYQGRFPVFDISRIKTYPLAERQNKVHIKDLLDLASVSSDIDDVDPTLIEIVHRVLEARMHGRPVILMTGAHLIKNGFGPLLCDLIRRRLITLIAMNGAGVIHDFELALIGQTSETVVDALPKGKFGFAEETSVLINHALIWGEGHEIGMGEALGRLISGEACPQRVSFPYIEVSVLAEAWRCEIPVTAHVGIGTDIIDQHPSWNASAKGGCSGRDFLIFAAEVERIFETGGGVFLNIGSSVIGPEVFLKACSMSANIGKPPNGLTTAVFDIRAVTSGDVYNERSSGYYFRDFKSVVTRIPEAFNGMGYYIQGDHLKTIPLLHQLLIRGF